MKLPRLLSASVAVVAFLGVGAAPLALAQGQDMVAVAPKNCTVLLNNERVRVIRVVTRPGDKIPLHSHPANIVYALTAGKAKFTTPDGKSEERVMKAGQTIGSDAVTHSTENTGTTVSRVLVIELKK
jgi:quercetin dioxygenase-like cupin family protein